MSGKLLDLLQPLWGERPCLFMDGEQWSYAELLAEAGILRAQWGLMRSQRVALDGLSARSLIPALLALDGEVEALLLLPANADSSLCDILMAQASCTHRLSEHGLYDLVQHTVDTSWVGATRWLLATSGTTGTPKLIEHTLRSLSRSCRCDSRRGAEYVWGLLYDPARFGGLQVLLQALLAGSALVLLDGLPISRQVELLLQGGVNALSATPSLWRRLLMDERSTQLPLRQVTLGGEIADAVILQVLRSRYPQARLVHIYASTEAGVGFAVQDGLPGFPVRWLATGEAGIDLRVRNDGHLLIRPRLPVGGGEIARRTDAEGYLDTGDLVLLQGDRVLFLGRDSGVINVGGNKVSPEQIESFLRLIPGVIDARVSGRHSSMMGQLVAAELVIAPDRERSALRREILQQCRAGLERWQVPALLDFVDTLPETPAGKRERIME